MSSSNNIYAARGLSPHPFKAGESNKDSSGMGGGGMYFSQRQKEEEEEHPETQEPLENPFDVPLEEMEASHFSIAHPTAPPDESLEKPGGRGHL